MSGYPVGYRSEVREEEVAVLRRARSGWTEDRLVFVQMDLELRGTVMPIAIGISPELAAEIAREMAIVAEQLRAGVSLPDMETAAKARAKGEGA